MSQSGVPEPQLRVENISKTFGSSRVLSHFDLELARGEIHALVGENGSGKSTFVKILAGLHEPDEGASVRIRGVETKLGNPKLAEKAGLRFVHQDLGLVLEQSVVENLGLGVGYEERKFGAIDWRGERRFAEELLRSFGLEVDARTPVAELSMSERTGLAIARALSPRRGEAVLLVLDEPTANLPGPEAERLFEIVESVRKSGVAVLLISHYLDEVLRHTDKVTVLRGGEKITTVASAQSTSDQLLYYMTGREILPRERQDSSAEFSSSSAMRVEELHADSITELSMRIAPGEIVGVAGITGSGREDLAPALVGQIDSGGKVWIGNELVSGGGPERVIHAGVGYVPAERGRLGLLQSQSVRENLTIGDLSPFNYGGMYLSRAAENSDCDEWISRLDIRPRDVELDIGSLSGGNQQKVMIARALRLEPRVLILDEPTQGVDVGAQAEIHRAIQDAADRGIAVLVCSSVNEELLELADRVLVMNGGRVAQELRSPVNADEILAWSLSTEN